MFPQLFPGEVGEDAAVFGALRTQLDDEWYVFYGRELIIGDEQGRLDFILLHRECGVAIIAVDVPDAAIDAAPTVAIMRRYLDELGFAALFARLPSVVVLGVVPPLDGLRDALLDRFAALPLSRPADPDWVEWLADRLTVAADLTTTDVAPAGEVFEEAEPDFRHVAPSPADAALVDGAPAAADLPHPMTVAASDRALVRGLGILTLFGALFGALALAMTGFSAPPSAASAPAAVTPPSPAVAERLAQPLPMMTKPEPPDEAASRTAATRAPIHKPHRRRVASRHRPRARSFWNRVASVFH
jgi:hypothetical protein